MPAFLKKMNDFMSVVAEPTLLQNLLDLSMEKRRPEFISRIRRSGEHINNGELKLTFLTEMPMAWRGFSEFGYTPTGSQEEMKKQTITMAHLAATAICSFHQKEYMQKAKSQGALSNFVGEQIGYLRKSLPFFLKAMVYSDQGLSKAIGSIGSISGQTLTLDNTGFSNSELIHRSYLFHRGMWIQSYRAGTKVNAPPVRVTHVDHKLGKVTLDGDLTSFASGDYLMITSPDGLDVPYLNMPGLYDVMADDNVFQGVDRSLAENDWARCDITNLNTKVLSFEMLDDLFIDWFNPTEVFTHPDVIRAYYLKEIRDKERFVQGSGSYSVKDGVPSLQVGTTKMVGYHDLSPTKILNPDLNDLTIATDGKFTRFDQAGWTRVAGRPLYQYSVATSLMLYAKDMTNYNMAENLDITLT